MIHLAGPAAASAVMAFRPPPIRLISRNVPVGDLHEQLLANPQLWNQHRARTENYAHSDISDIWVRAHADSSDLQRFHEPHQSVWYPAFDQLPALRPMIFNVMRFVEGEQLGGVLITKIPAGSEVKPHVDRGWHASFYSKFAVQVAADERQCFHFETASLITQPGDLFTFDNSRLHSVVNDSDVDRITLICCIKTSRRFLGE